MQSVEIRWRLFFFSFILFNLSLVVYSQNKNNNSAFGKVLTPKGDLRVLIIYAGFDGFDDNQPYHNWGFGNSMPVYDPKELFYSDFNDFEKYKNDTINLNISRYYYELSSSSIPFRIVADVFPSRINIDPTDTYSFGDCNKRVMEKMQKDFPDFDWSPYDKRTNSPNYKFDNSITPPDKKPDYVIIAYRYVPGWQKQPREGMKYWAYNYSRLDGINALKYNGYTFDASGFTLANFQGKLGDFKGLFLHELAHELFSSPHYSGANGALGRYFFLPAFGWDMMNNLGGFSSNSFERWLLGWIEIKHDLKDRHDNGNYYLKDNITTGEAIRIKIPHTKSQYLWIENHQKISFLDHTLWRGGLKDIPKGSKGIPDKESGIYMFIEDILDDRQNIDVNLVFNLEKVNGIMPLNASGNFDFKKPIKFSQSPDEFWNNKLYWFEKDKENSLSGINPYMNVRFDFDNNGTINNVIGSFGEYNGIKDSESSTIIKEVLNGNPKLTYASLGGRNQDAIPFRRSDTFQKGDIINLSSNPMIVNRPTYSKTSHQLSPFYLNGLSIQILDFKEGTYKLKIDFNKTEVNKNVRWCGNIISKPVENHENHSDIFISNNSELRLDKSGTPNKLPSPFVNATLLTIDSGAVLRVGKKSSIVINEGSTLIIKKSGQLVLEKGSFIKVDSISHLEFEEGAIIDLDPSSEINIPNEQALEMNSDLKANLKNHIHIFTE